MFAGFVLLLPRPVNRLRFFPQQSRQSVSSVQYGASWTRLMLFIFRGGAAIREGRALLLRRGHLSLASFQRSDRPRRSPRLQKSGAFRQSATSAHGTKDPNWGIAHRYFAASAAYALKAGARRPCFIPDPNPEESPPRSTALAAKCRWIMREEGISQTAKPLRLLKRDVVPVLFPGLSATAARKAALNPGPEWWIVPT